VRDFDEPCDELDNCFSSWGEQEVPKISNFKPLTRAKQRLTAVYLPQYRLGGWELLPYTALSLDAVKQNSDGLDGVRKNVVFLADTWDDSASKIRRLVDATAARTPVELSRIVAGLVSFLAHLASAADMTRIVDECAAGIDGSAMAELLDDITKGLSDSYSIEAEAKSDLGALSLSRLDALGAGQNVIYTPSHILICSMTKEDWTPCSREAAARIIGVCCSIARRLSG